MQWIDHPVVVDTPGSSVAMGVPADVIALSRFFPACVLCLFCMFYPSWADFHWQCMIICDAMLLCCCTIFWMNEDRRASVPKVLLRSRFWRRCWSHCLLPLVLSSFLFVAMESADSKMIHAMWHVILAGLAASIIRTVFRPDGVQTIFDESHENPVVAHILLGSVAVFGLSTIVASLLLDWRAVGYWRWPLLCMASGQRPGGYLVVIGALPSLSALALAFWLINSTVGDAHTEPKEVVLSKRLGCTIGYIGVVFGFLACAITESVSQSLHTLCLTVFMCMMIVAMLLTTLSSRYVLAAGQRVRCTMTFLTFVVMMLFVMLFMLDQQVDGDDYKVPRTLLALAEYAALALLSLWPLTWASEVQERWQVHRQWRGVLSDRTN